MRKIKKYVISAAAAGILIAGGQNVKAAELNTDELLPKELQTDQAEPVLENTAPAAQPAAPDETFPSPQETAPEFTQMPEEMTQAPDPLRHWQRTHRGSRPDGFPAASGRQ